MARFIALPVAVGDAFFCESNGHSMLVDGGKNRNALPDLFRSHVRADGVDTLVCTHNDADHANGVLGFLQSGLHCGEVWLPGRWLAVMQAVMQAPEVVTRQLVDEIGETSQHYGAFWSDDGERGLKEIAARVSGELKERVHKGSVHTLDEAGWPTSLAFPGDAEGHANDEDGLSAAWWRYWYVRNRRAHWQIALLEHAIDTAARIRLIAEEAINNGVPIRWFEYSSQMPTGGSQHLVPLNSRRIASWRQPDAPLLWRLALTVVNEESLVFWSPKSKVAPGVLFTADSDLSGAALPAGIKGAIVTAPHHGSETNASAFASISRSAGADAGSLIWVRSDHNSKRNPGPSFLVNAMVRYCTICRGPANAVKQKAPVELNGSAGMWRASANTSPCTCQ